MATLHDRFIGVCARKLAYDQYDDAEAAAERTMTDSPDGGTLVVYRCPFAPLDEGGHYHVGHQHPLQRASVTTSVRSPCVPKWLSVRSRR